MRSIGITKRRYFYIAQHFDVYFNHSIPRYYLEAHYSNPTTKPGLLRVGIQIYKAPFNTFQTGDARNEAQAVTITSTLSDEEQVGLLFYPQL